MAVTKVSCHLSTASQTAAASSRGVGAHGRLVGEPAHPEGNAGHRGQGGIAVEHTGQGVVEDGSVVAARAHDDLPVHLDPPVEQGSQPPQAGRPAAVAQQVGPDVGIGGVDGDEQRAEVLGEHPLEIHLREAGQGGEVAVEEGEPVVVVLQREAAPHPLRELMDEAELAVVVARPDPVEDGRGHLGAEGLPRLLAHPDGEGLVDARGGGRPGRGRVRPPAGCTRSRHTATGR